MKRGGVRVVNKSLRRNGREVKEREIVAAES